VAYWEKSVRRFESEIYKGHATVLANQKGLKQLRNLSSAVANALAAVSPSRRRGGWFQASIPIESTDHAIGQILPLAPHVEVIHPADLRKAIVARLKEAVRVYRTVD
jgi:predicted DNA-binding transcriptional regulator YafY